MGAVSRTVDPSSKWTFTLRGWVGGICNGVSPEARVEGGIEMGPENLLGLANSGLLLLKLDRENPPPKMVLCHTGCAKSVLEFFLGDL